jgi:hypothetical protein
VFLACFLGQAIDERRLLPAAASSQESRSDANATMGAENSKPSSEVKQHVFSSYVPLHRANGSCLALEAQ